MAGRHYVADMRAPRDVIPKVSIGSGCHVAYTSTAQSPTVVSLRQSSLLYDAVADREIA